jgi:anti-sigma regulatory factor (Ser/Thr protein kinase)
MGFGAGMGLPNIKRNADALELTSQVGKGTTLRAVVSL